MSASNLPPGVSDYDIERQAYGGQDPHMMQAIERASEAFWAEIAKAYPLVKSGDFPPEADFAFENAQVAAVETWLWANLPSEDDLSMSEIRAIEQAGMDADNARDFE